MNNRLPPKMPTSNDSGLWCWTCAWQPAGRHTHDLNTFLKYRNQGSDPPAGQPHALAGNMGTTSPSNREGSGLTSNRWFEIQACRGKLRCAQVRGHEPCYCPYEIPQVGALLIQFTTRSLGPQPFSWLYTQNENGDRFFPRHVYVKCSCYLFNVQILNLFSKFFQFASEMTAECWLWWVWWPLSISLHFSDLVKIVMFSTVHVL